MNILIAEPLAPAGIELFQSQPGWNVIVSNPKEYAQHLCEADALLVRSAVQVNQRGAGKGAEAARHRPRRAWAWTTSISTPPPPPACW